MKKYISIFLLLNAYLGLAQVTLDANGAGNTYEEITAVLAPNYSPVEAPDCNHLDFGRHIDEVFDAELNTHVFRFFIHTSPDNDRCLKFDRQRNEIKTYDKSPDNLKGVENETVRYKWKFKLDADFQVSPSFTHVHQLKAVGGSLSSMPMYTITLRKSTPDRLELRYAETESQITLQQTDLAPFKGVWLEVEETITYGNMGSYTIEISRVDDGVDLFNYSNQNIINWRENADFIRPKWGIYRSLNSAEDLRDEEVLFANISIEELSNLWTEDFNSNDNFINLLPNPTQNQLIIVESAPKLYDSYSLFNQLGQKIVSKNNSDKIIDLFNLSEGLYSVVFFKNNKIVLVKKALKN